MHAGVFGARISEEAFRILLELMEINFAALNIPEENQTDNNNAVAISKKITSESRSRNPVPFRDNICIKVSHLIQKPGGQEIRGIFEIVLPIFRNPWPDRIIMNHGKSLEDSHEPMEIEEISYTEAIDEVKPFIKIEKEWKQEDSRPKTILRESKLTKVLEGQKATESNGVDQDPKEIFSSLENHETKPKLRPLVKRGATIANSNEKSSLFYFWQMLFFILFPIAVLVACVSIAREEFDSEICAHRFDPTEAIKDLENRVFGQTRAIQELAPHLGMNSSGLKLLAITGGTGVGKSYAAHIISENFSARKNVFQFIPPLKQRRRFASGAVSFCGCNLIILENLNNRDVEDAANFVEYLAGKIDNENYCLLIIGVINVQETDANLKRGVDLANSKAEIENIYRNKNLDIKVVQFERLDDAAVAKCIIDAAKSRNLTLSESEIDDVRISLKISDSGCKGANAKVQLLDKKSGFI